MSRSRLLGSCKAGDVDLEPTFEWHDRANHYFLLVDLPGFKKEEFQVLVDPSGRVTIRGQRPAGQVRLYRAFQLPHAADPGRIAARFDGSTLHLTVPKLPVGATEMVWARMAAAAEWETETEKEQSRWGKGEVFAAAVAAFALGVIVAEKVLLSRNN